MTWEKDTPEVARPIHPGEHNKEQNVKTTYQSLVRWSHD